MPSWQLKVWTWWPPLFALCLYGKWSYYGGELEAIIHEINTAIAA